jgi:hypothetical protein
MQVRARLESEAFSWLTWALCLWSLVFCYASRAWWLVAFFFRDDTPCTAEQIAVLSQGGFSRCRWVPDWSWDFVGWVPSLLALVMSAVLWRRSLRRAPSFRFVRGDALDNGGYRSPAPWHIEVTPGALRRGVARHRAHLGLALGLGFVSFSSLTESWFTYTPGCCICSGPRRPWAQYLLFCTLSLAVVAWHAPTRRRILGPKPEAPRSG